MHYLQQYAVNDHLDLWKRGQSLQTHHSQTLIIKFQAVLGTTQEYKFPSWKKFHHFSKIIYLLLY